MGLSGKEKFSYGLGAVGKDMVYMLSASYILYYYQDILGVNAVAMGIILLVARVFDAFNDPFMGVIVAKTRTRWGKFRPWLMIGTVTNAVVLYLMFSAPPALDGNGLVAYAAVTYILWGVTYTTSNLVIYFFKYDFGGDTWYNSYTLFNTFGGAVQILAMMLLFPLLRKFMSTIRIFYVSFLMAIAGYAVLLLLCFTNMSTVFLLFLPGFLIFAANGMLTVLTTVFLANTVDYGQWKNHRRDESVIFSMQTFVVKLASGISALVASLCLNLCNLSSDTSDAAAATGASGSSVVGLRMTMALFPILLLVIGVIFFHKKYQLTEKRLKEIQEA